MEEAEDGMKGKEGEQTFHFQGKENRIGSKVIFSIFVNHHICRNEMYTLGT